MFSAISVLNVMHGDYFFDYLIHVQNFFMRQTRASLSTSEQGKRSYFGELYIPWPIYCFPTCAYHFLLLLLLLLLLLSLLLLLLYLNLTGRAGGGEGAGGLLPVKSI